MDDAAALEKTIEQLDGQVAAFFCEPVIGAGGVYPPPPGYLAEVRDICRRHEVLFVADEVITGFGRVGEWFASGRFSLDPDLITTAKGLSSGYLPIGAVIAAGRVAEPFWRAGSTGCSGTATRTRASGRGGGGAGEPGPDRTRAACAAGAGA